jgi:hypothetical protein
MREGYAATDHTYDIDVALATIFADSVSPGEQQCRLPQLDTLRQDTL